MHWETKSLVFRTLARLPFGTSLHYLLQRHLTREWPRHPEIAAELVDAAVKIAAHFPSLTTTRFVEIGAGRDLAVALSLRMLGAQSVTTLDIEPLARLSEINHTAKHIARILDQPEPHFDSFADLRDWGVTYLAPMTLAELPGAFDCFYSVDTLEHIPPEALAGVLRAARERIRPGGLAVHFIDYSDHYARGTDATRINFLRYTDAQWAKHNSRFQYVNRLRHSEYLAMFADAGLPVSQAEPFALELNGFAVDELAPRFRDMSREDIATIRSKVVASPN